MASSITRSLARSSIKSCIFSKPTKPSSFFNPSSPFSSKRHSSFISRSPVELACFGVGSMYPLHNVVAAVRLTSRLSIAARSCRDLSQELIFLSRGHYSNILLQARQTISHQRVCVNVGNRNAAYFYSTAQDDKPEEDKPQDERKSLVDVYGEGIRRRFYVHLLLEKIISKPLPQRLWRRTKAEWYRLLRTRRGSRLLLKSRFLRDLHTTMQEEDMERTKKLGSEKVCLGSSFASKRRKDQSLNLPRKPNGPFASKASIYNDSTYASSYPFTRKPRIRRIELPTHYLEINYKTLKAVVTYGPNVSHIPSKIRHLL